MLRLHQTGTLPDTICSLAEDLGLLAHHVTRNQPLAVI